jgi:hypothetical protein
MTNVLKVMWVDYVNLVIYIIQEKMDFLLRLLYSNAGNVIR